MGKEQSDPDVFAHGTPVAVLRNLKTDTVEQIVQEVQHWSGGRLDWSWFGGRAVVRGIGTPFEMQSARNIFKALCSPITEDGTIEY